MGGFRSLEQPRLWLGQGGSAREGGRGGEGGPRFSTRGSQEVWTAFGHKVLCVKIENDPKNKIRKKTGRKKFKKTKILEKNNSRQCHTIGLTPLLVLVLVLVLVPVLVLVLVLVLELVLVLVLVLDPSLVLGPRK